MEEDRVVTYQDIKSMLDMIFRPRQQLMYYIGGRAYNPSNVQDMKDLADFWHSRLPTDMESTQDTANANVVSNGTDSQG